MKQGQSLKRDRKSRTTRGVTGITFQPEMDRGAD